MEDKEIELLEANLKNAESELKKTMVDEDPVEHNIGEALQEVKESEIEHHEIKFEIIVNGRLKIVTKKELSFTEIVDLAFGSPIAGDNIVFTVVYRRGEGNKPEGSLVDGETVKIKNGMIFDVTATDKS